MANSRGSRCQETDQLALYVDGVPMGASRADEACLGDVHIFSAATTLTEPVTYKWYIDSIHNTPVSEKNYYGYTFDDETHVIYLVASNTRCGIQVTIDAKGRECTDCTVECVLQTAYLPAGELVSLIDEDGTVHKIPARLTTECVSFSRANRTAASAVKRIVKIAGRCRTSTLNAQLYYNKSTPNCLTLNITNSPVKFTSIQVGNTKYSFTGC